MVVRTAQPFEPSGGVTMPVRSCPPRDLAVGNVAKQHVLEGVLHVSGHRRSRLSAHEVLPFEGAEEPLCLGKFDVSRRCDAAGPEDLAVHRCRLKQLFLRRGQRVDSRGDHALHRFRQLTGRAALGKHADVLLGKERVAPCPLE